jgi:glycosyltransferase involved in cell wall biosynthesis
MRDANNSGSARVSAVVPAREEAPTIRGVLDVLVGHPLIDEVIVVDDASTDDTAARARAAGAVVIAMPRKGGKAAALSLGVAAARNDLLFFRGADLMGLTAEAISRTLTPVLLHDCGMFVGIRGRRTYWANRLLHFTPIIGGERALTRALWEQVLPAFKKSFQIEIALNFFAKLNGHRMGFAVLPGISQVIKEKKRGLVRGLWQRLAMIGDILLVSWRIYVVLQARMLFERRPRELKS